jgi:hypothetical protein
MPECGPVDVYACAARWGNAHAFRRRWATTNDETHRVDSGLARRKHAAAVALELDAAVVHLHLHLRAQRCHELLVHRRATRTRFALGTRRAPLCGSVGYVRLEVVRAVCMLPGQRSERLRTPRERIFPRRVGELDVVTQGQPDVVMLRECRPHSAARRSFSRASVATPPDREAAKGQRSSEWATHVIRQVEVVEELDTLSSRHARHRHRVQRRAGSASARVVRVDGGGEQGAVAIAAARVVADGRARVSTHVIHVPVARLGLRAQSSSVSAREPWRICSSKRRVGAHVRARETVEQVRVNRLLQRSHRVQCIARTPRLREGGDSHIVRVQ